MYSKNNNFTNFGELQYSPQNSLLQSVDFYKIIVTLFSIGFIVICTQTIPSFIMKLLGASSPTWLGIFYYIGILAAIALFALAPIKTSLTLFKAWPFVLLLLWEIATNFWSSEPSETLRSTIIATFSFLGAVSICAHLEWKRFIYLLNLVLTGVIFVSLLLIFGLPSIGRMQEIYPGAWSGLFQEKQALGFAAAQQFITALALAFSYKEYRKWGFAAALGAFAIMGTQSKTALVMLVVILAIFVVAWLTQQGKIIATFTIAGVLIGGTIIFFVLKFAPDIIFALLHKKKDFTGRTDIWEGMELLIQQRPLLGWGYGTIWKSQNDLAAAYQWIYQHTDFHGYNGHSSHKDMILQVGKIGYVFFLLAIIRTFISSLLSISKGGIPMYFSLATLVSVINISFTESVLVNPMEMSWVLVTIIGTKLLMKDETQKNIQEPKNDFDNTYTYKIK